MAESTHPADCPCQRCKGFAVGNIEGSKTVKHSAYGDLTLGPRVEKLAEQIRGLVPMYRQADDLAVRTLALVLARIEAAYTHLEGTPAGDMLRLEADLRGWVNTERRLLNDLGLTPASRARLGVDVAVAQRVRTLTTMHEDAALERGERDVIEGDAVDDEAAR